MISEAILFFEDHSYIVFALAMGLGFSCLSGPIGSFMVWRRLSFLGDTIAHGTLLGAVISIFFAVNIDFIIACLCVIMALLMLVGTFPLKQNRADKDKSSEAKLVLLSHGSMAFGILGLFLLQIPMSEFTDLLFGDILAVSLADLYIMFAFSAFMLVMLCLYWRPFMMIVISEDIASSQGISVTIFKTAFAISLGLTIGLSLKLIGALLMTALFIIPAITARFFARTPLQMILLSSCICFFSFLFGLALSYGFDTPTGPSIVCTSVVIYIFSAFIEISKLKI